MPKNHLKKELEYFKKIKANLLQTNKGQFALIKGDELVGTYTKFEEAYETGIEKFGEESFLVKPIAEKESPHLIPALDNCLINAGI